MDDEPSVSKALARMLAHLGYQAESVEDGQAALDAYRRAMATGKPYAAVIMDLTIPGGMGGKDTMRKLSALDPQARAIVSSGYSNDPIMSEYASHGFSGVLTKPYSMEEVSAALHRVIGPEK
ncbi:MAG: response regulator [Elusimicrobiota bacterium]